MHTPVSASVPAASEDALAATIANQPKASESEESFPGASAMVTSLMALFQTQMEAMRSFKSALDQTAMRFADPVDKLVASMALGQGVGTVATSTVRHAYKDVEAEAKKPSLTKKLLTLGGVGTLEEEIHKLPESIAQALADQGVGAKPGYAKAAPGGGDEGVPHASPGRSRAKPKVDPAEQVRRAQVPEYLPGGMPSIPTINSIKHADVGKAMLDKLATKLANKRTAVDWSEEIPGREHITAADIGDPTRFAPVSDQERASALAEQNAPEIPNASLYHPIDASGLPTQQIIAQAGDHLYSPRRIVPNAKSGTLGSLRQAAGDMGGRYMASEEGGGGMLTSLMSAAGPKGLELAGGLEAAGPYAAVAATAIKIGQKALNFTHEQASANQQYTQYTGQAPMGTAGYRARIGEKLFDYSNILGMGGGTASKIYGASYAAAGSNKDLRNQFQTAATSMYTSKGISAEDSIRMLNIALATGNENLSAFSTSIKAVSDAAREGGRSAKEAQDMFTAAYQGFAAQAPTSTATSLATATTLTNMGVARNAGTDYSGIMSSAQQAKAAATLNMSPADYQAKLAQGGPEAARMTARAADLGFGEFAATAMSPQLIAQATQMAKGKTDADDWSDIAALVARSFGGVSAQQFADMVYTETGHKPDDPGDSYAWFAKHAFGDKDTYGIEAATSKVWDTTKMKEGTGKGEINTKVSVLGVHPITVSAAESKQAKQDYGVDIGPEGSTAFAGVKTSGKKGKTRMDALMANATLLHGVSNSGSAIAFVNKYGDNTSTRFLVSDNKGNQVVMTAMELVEKDVEQIVDEPDKITVYTGPDANKTLAEALDLKGYKDSDALSGVSSKFLGESKGPSSLKNLPQGTIGPQSKQAYDASPAGKKAKAADTTAASGNGTVMVSLTAEAQKYLEATFSSDPNTPASSTS